MSLHRDSGRSSGRLRSTSPTPTRSARLVQTTHRNSVQQVLRLRSRLFRPLSQPELDEPAHPNRSVSGRSTRRFADRAGQQLAAPGHGAQATEPTHRASASRTGCACSSSARCPRPHREEHSLSRRMLPQSSADDRICRDGDQARIDGTARGRVMCPPPEERAARRCSERMVSVSLSR